MTETGSEGQTTPPWADITEYDMEDVLKWRQDHSFASWVEATHLLHCSKEVTSSEIEYSESLDETYEQIVRQVVHEFHTNPCCTDAGPQHMFETIAKSLLDLGIRIGARGAWLTSYPRNVIPELREGTEMEEQYEIAAINWAKFVAWKKEQTKQAVASIRERFKSDHGVILVQTPEEMAQVISLLDGEPQSETPQGGEPQTGMYL